jgi:hypothetical protein
MPEKPWCSFLKKVAFGLSRTPGVPHFAAAHITPMLHKLQIFLILTT